MAHWPPPPPATASLSSVQQPRAEYRGRRRPKAMPDERYAHLRGDTRRYWASTGLLPLGAAERPGARQSPGCWCRQPARPHGPAHPLPLLQPRGTPARVATVLGYSGPRAHRRRGGGCAWWLRTVQAPVSLPGPGLGGWMATGEPQQPTGNVAKAQLTQPNRRSQGPASSCEAVHAPLFST